jgi:excisionase family DNA binding protein
VTIEDTLGAVVEAKLAPFRLEVGKLSSEIEALRRALPPMLVSMAEAARRLGVSLSTIKRRARDGSLPVRRFGRALRVDLAAVREPEEAEVIRLSLAAKRG